MKLSEKIISEIAGRHELLLWYLGQAGFLLKTGRGQLVAIDPYLSDAAERLFGFKRMIPAVIRPEELNVDYYLSTHSHIDHLDADILPAVAECGKTLFIGSPDCEAVYRQNGIPDDRRIILKTGDRYESADLTVRAVYADHGDLAPDATGLLVKTDGIRVFHTGDTAFVPEKIAASLQTGIDILIAPINAQYGNMNVREACQLASILQPKILIASHFWMFLEHVGEGGQGDPATFLREAAHLPKSVTPLVMAPGEKLKYQKQ
jgi:L-ascorbate 6-phosphate lactonase